MVLFTTYHISVIQDEVRASVYRPGSQEPAHPRGEFRINQFRECIDTLVKKVRRNTVGQGDITTLGECLYQSLFDDALNIDFRNCFEEADDIHVELDVEDKSVPDIASLPWEFLRAPATTRYSALDFISHPHIILSRRRELWMAASPLDSNQKLRIQLAYAAPDDKNLGPVEYESVWAAIQKLAIAFPELIDEPELIPHVTLNSLDNALKKRPHILHFIGHGRLIKANKKERGQLALIKNDGHSADWTPEDRIAQLFERHKPAVVILQACESGALHRNSEKGSPFVGIASKVVQRNIPFVIAMQYEISNQASVTFAEVLYSQLQNREPLDLAVQEARRRLSLSFPDTRDPMSIVLFSRVRDGQLFHAEPAHELPEQSDASALLFPAEIIREYPYPIAVACDGFNQAQENTARFVNLDNALVNAVKLLSVIALAQYRQEVNVNHTTLREWLSFLAQPTLAAWTNLLGKIADYYGSGEESPLKIIFDLYHTPLPKNSPMDRAARYLAEEQHRDALANYTPRSFIELAAVYREAKWATNPGLLGENRSSQLIPILQPALQHFSEFFSVLTGYPLRYIVRADLSGTTWMYEMREFRGPDSQPIRTTPFAEDSSESKAGYAPFRLYLCDAIGRPLVDLHPFLACIDLKLYFLDFNVSNRAINYLPCGPGERFRPPAYFASFMLSIFESDSGDPDQAIEQAKEQLDEINSPENVSPIESVPLETLLARLSDEGREAVEMALGEALRLGHFWVGIEFLLMSLSRQNGTALPEFLRQIGVEPGILRGILRGFNEVQTESWRDVDVKVLGESHFDELTFLAPEQLSENYRSAVPKAVVTPRMLRVLRDALGFAQSGSIGHIHFLKAIVLHTESLATIALLSLANSSHWTPKKVLEWIDQQQTTPDRPQPGTGDNSDKSGGAPPYSPVSPPKGSILEQYGRDLNAEVQIGKIHPATGADGTIRKLTRILLQRETNNPLLIGEPGVGKTAVVEGLAYKIVHRKIKALEGKRIIELSRQNIMAYTKFRGQLEERIQQLIDEVRSRPDVIIFIDEIHALLDESSSGHSELANALKPALARGQFPCIGATTLSEYRKHFEKDEAFRRRWGVVLMEEPSEADCIKILEGLRDGLANDYGVRIAQSGIEAAVRLSSRYIPDARLPAKAIKLIHEACTYVLVPSISSGEEIANHDQPMFSEVNDDLIRYLLSKDTGIPLERLSGDEVEGLKGIEDALRSQVIGQIEAIRIVAQAIRRSRMGLADKRRPIGVFLFVGPTGVGKTELARALTKFLFNDEDAIIRLDMGEYSDKTAVTRLVGASPGYVGYEEGAYLTERLRLHPYSVVLLDEIEKAHSEVHNALLTLFDEGRLTDNKGHTVDGRNSIFIMTSNVGSEVYEQSPGISSLAEKQRNVERVLHTRFASEFMARVEIIYFKPLELSDVESILEIHLDPFQKLIHSQYGINLRLTLVARQYICSVGYDARTGIRNLKRTMDKLVVDQITNWIADGTFRPQDNIDIDSDGTTLSFERRTIMGGTR